MAAWNDFSPVPVLAPVRQAYAGLAPRERRLVQVAGAIVLAFLAFGILSGLRSTRTGMERRIASKETDLEEISQLRSAYLALRQDTDLLYTDAKSRPAEFSLFSFLEGVGTRAMPKEKISAMNPSTRPLGDEFVEDSVEMKIGGVNLQELVELLYRMRRGPVPLRVSRLSLRKRFNDPTSFDVTLTVSMLTRSAPA